VVSSSSVVHKVIRRTVSLNVHKVLSCQYCNKLVSKPAPVPTCLQRVMFAESRWCLSAETFRHLQFFGDVWTAKMRYLNVEVNII
jgi:hypothetical protein